MKQNERLRLWAILVWIAVWQGGSLLLRVLYPHGALLLASPADALLRLLELGITAAFWRAIVWSAVRIFGGFLAACVLAVFLAILASRRDWIRQLLAPLVSVIKTVPVASFIILALVWLRGSQLSLFISGLMVFPPVYLGVLEGLQQTDRDLLEMAEVYQVPAGRQLRYIYLPQTLPYFRSAVSVALGLCWKAEIAAEVIGICSGSIGERLYTAKVYYQTPDLFAWTAVIVLISVVFERLFLAMTDAIAGKVGG